MYHVFAWQLLSPVFASWWVLTQSQTFQRKNKVHTRSPTTDFSPILTSQISLVLTKSTGRKKKYCFPYSRVGKKHYNYLNILHISPQKIYRLSLYLYMRRDVGWRAWIVLWYSLVWQRPSDLKHLDLFSAI